MKQLEIKLNNTKKVSKALKEELTKRGDAVKKLESDLKASQESVMRKEEEVSSKMVSKALKEELREVML